MSRNENSLLGLTDKVAIVIVAATGLVAATAKLLANAIYPGSVVTEVWDKLGHTEQQRATWLKDIVAEIPLKREPTAETVAKCIVFLTSDLTGQLIATDGGYALGLYSPMYEKKG